MCMYLSIHAVVLRSDFFTLALPNEEDDFELYLTSEFEESDDPEGPNIRENSEIDSNCEEEKDGSRKVSRTVSQALSLPPHTTN